MPNLIFPGEIGPDEIAAWLKKDMDTCQVENKGKKVWLERNLFQGCHIRPMPNKDGTKIVIAGDMSVSGKIVMLLSVAVFGLILYAVTGLILVGGLLVFGGIALLRFLPSLGVEAEVTAAIKKHCEITVSG